MAYTLEKGKFYQWIKPHTCAGLRFKVVNMETDSDNRFRSVYRIEYVNYPYFPRPAALRIGTQFVHDNSDCLMKI